MNARPVACTFFELVAVVGVMEPEAIIIGHFIMLLCAVSVLCQNMQWGSDDILSFGSVAA